MARTKKRSTKKRRAHRLGLQRQRGLVVRWASEDYGVRHQLSRDIRLGFRQHQCRPAAASSGHRPTFGGWIRLPAGRSRRVSLTNDFFFTDCNNIVWSGDIAQGQGTPSGCSVDIIPSSPQSTIRATFTDSQGQTGFAERVVLVGATGGLSVVITNPLPGSQGIFFFEDSNRSASLPLEANITDTVSNNINIAWIFSTTDGKLFLLSGANPFIWTPHDTLPYNNCSGPSGTLGILVTDDKGNVAGATVPMTIVVSPC